MTKKKLIFNILSQCLFYMFFISSVLLLILTIVSKRENENPSILNLQTKIVVSSSMEKNDSTYNQIKTYRIKSLPVKSLLLIKNTPINEKKRNNWYNDLEIGDVLTFCYLIGNKQEIITHRLIKKELNDNNELVLTLKGDNVEGSINENIQIINTSDENSPNYIIGKVIFKSTIIGKIVYFLKQPIGVLTLVIIPSLGVTIYEVIKLINIIVNEYKKKSLDKDETIKALKDKLASLETSKESS